MRNFLKGIGALVLLAGLLVGVVEGIGVTARLIGRQLFHGVDPTVSAAAVTAMSTVLVAVATLVIGRYFERRKAIEAEIRTSKIPVYSRLVGGIFAILNTPEGPERQAAAEALFRDLTPDLITWASDDVIVAWSHFKRKISSLPPEEVVFALEKVLMEIRSDYGHGGSKIAEGDLVGLFINDIDDILARRNSREISP